MYIYLQVHVSSPFTVSGKPVTTGQSILINQNQSQPPLYVTNKKIIKPPPLVPQSTPTTQNFIIPINISLNQQINKTIATPINQQGAKLIKTTTMPALTSTSAPKSLLHQQVLKPIQRTIQPGKSLISPSVAAANITLQQQQKLLNSVAPNAPVQVRAQQQPKLTTTTVKTHGTTLSPVQQRQILQNIISQQQKQHPQRPNMISLVSSNSVIVNSTQPNQQSNQFHAVQSQQSLHQQPKTVIVSQQNLVQKIVTNSPTIPASIHSTTSTDSNALNSQIIQIHQVNQMNQPGKVQRVSAANLTPQQQQNILQSIKQQQLRVQQTGSPQQQSLIIKQQQVLQHIQKQQQTLTQQPVSSPKPGKILLQDKLNIVSMLFSDQTCTYLGISLLHCLD